VGWLLLGAGAVFILSGLGAILIGAPDPRPVGWKRL